ncbi:MULTISPECIES: Uma2 family endonuclease [Calothrix]|uniref:Uma2 family endonuclease n=2 Tax=Calothrix TaxID=1186 RepID=A0ABR8AFF4_9CYAN|nr:MULTISPECIES: Uma2 family endonuclease [Calothrix]MBD2198767.1 Uma2 family endonuclease [Calothrix parietina FACHB-288]MBD2228585.1 Uma2 family endonuclease [Calothrix anomala FACHB-343]
MTPLTLNLNSVIKLTSEEFYQLCQDNPDLKLERNAAGELIIMPPTGGETGKRNVNLILQVAQWNEQNQLGEVFDSSTGFTLPNGADRSPDVSWIEKSRWNALTKEQREKFIPLCPDFVIEILSPSDRLQKVQEKMQEYLDNGCRLGLLINRKKQELEIYRPDYKVEILPAPQSFIAEDVLPGFILNLQKIWE